MLSHHRHSSSSMGSLGLHSYAQYTCSMCLSQFSSRA